MALILVANDNADVSQVLQQEFQRLGHQVLVSHADHDTLELAERYRPDLVVLSPALPQTGGTAVYQRIRAVPALSKTEVLFFSIQVRLEERPDNLERSVDPHARTASPFGELTMRVSSLLRRGNHERSSTPADHLSVGTLVLHCHNLTVERSGRVCNLTPTEYDLLRYLMLHADEACPTARLLQNVWGYPASPSSTNLVRTHIRNLRHKIEPRPARPVHLRTIRHYGYMLCSNGAKRETRWMAKAPAGLGARGLAYSQQPLA